MALVKCPDCGRKVSALALACPQCGRPIAQGSVPNNSLPEVIPNVLPSETPEETQKLQVPPFNQGSTDNAPPRRFLALLALLTCFALLIGKASGIIYGYQSQAFQTFFHEWPSRTLAHLIMLPLNMAADFAVAIDGASTAEQRMRGSANFLLAVASIFVAFKALGILFGKGQPSPKGIVVDDDEPPSGL